jgi:hypothetical protein
VETTISVKVKTWRLIDTRDLFWEVLFRSTPLRQQELQVALQATVRFLNCHIIAIGKFHF